MSEKHVQTKMDLISALPKKSDVYKITGDFDPVSNKIAQWLMGNYHYAQSYTNTTKGQELIGELDFQDGIRWFMELIVNDLREHQLDLEHEIEDYLIPLLR